jgi:hypothetical protein
MAEEGKDEDLFKRIESLGLRLEYDSAFLVVTRSASDQRRDDDAEIEQAVLEQLGKHMREVSSFAVGKARGVRGQNFVGRQVFVPPLKIVGTLQSVGEDGTVRVAYSQENYKDPELPDVQVIHSSSGADLLILVDDDAPASETSFTWIADERLQRLFVRADQAGLRLEHDSGFTIVNLRTVQGVERKVADGIIRELGAKQGQVYFLLGAIARGKRGAHFVGKRALVPALFNAFGIIESLNSDGKVAVRYRDKHTQSEVTCFCQGDDLLVVPDEKAAAEPSADQNSETTWQRLMRRAFGG